MKSDNNNINNDNNIICNGHTKLRAAPPMPLPQGKRENIKRFRMFIGGGGLYKKYAFSNF